MNRVWVEKGLKTRGNWEAKQRDWVPQRLRPVGEKHRREEGGEMRELGNTARDA